MEIKIEIRTPKGEAEKTEKRIKPFLIGTTKIKESWINFEGSQLIWVIEAPIRKILSIKRNVNRFDYTIQSILNSKAMKKTLVKHLNDKDQRALKKMLTDQTTVTVLNEATLQELDEYNKPFWSRIKEKFKKRN